MHLLQRVIDHIDGLILSGINTTLDCRRDSNRILKYFQETPFPTGTGNLGEFSPRFSPINASFWVEGLI
jgi:hypothetical protein